MAWLEQCDVCGGGGFFCCHRNPDLNQAAAACPHMGGSAGVLREFQFFGREDGRVAWLLNGAKTAEGKPDDRTQVAPLPVVAPAVRENADWRGDACSPRWPVLDGCSFPAGLLEAAPKSPVVDPSVVGHDTSVGATMPFLAADGSNNSDAAGEVDRATSSGKDDGGSSMDREARVLRYREKKKRRKFGKQIRYASRKAYAETRPRIRGRFAKAPEAPPPSYSSEHIDMGWYRAFRP